MGSDNRLLRRARPIRWSRPLALYQRERRHVGERFRHLSEKEVCA
jgi:hypothetical protein